MAKTRIKPTQPPATSDEERIRTALAPLARELFGDAGAVTVSVWSRNQACELEIVVFKDDDLDWL